jgi:hypothetical protein
MNTIAQANGDILTGKVWRKQHSFFNGLPFYSDAPRMDEMAIALKMTLSADSAHQCFGTLLVVRFSVFLFVLLYTHPLLAEIWSGP